eukprot:CAMPEP_0204226632 /NCGR_PEP_ID=MMETSP0361-20130328/85075_1 /ASSEMBLY_ACC=CAM_ASM_000343 /TAXON_ID=268821 /ORGANISM="Scrippsiella Hangoei, Strain SHTV-5" /LENGTH=51 /DNA_ID=CAMNT_0051193655 /DNA_START=57 /DNA_END=209 /DNA_ORIENTATION=-
MSGFRFNRAAAARDSHASQRPTRPRAGGLLGLRVLRQYRWSGRALRVPWMT